MNFKRRHLFEYRYKHVMPRTNRLKEGVVLAYSAKEARDKLETLGLKLVSFELDIIASLKSYFTRERIDKKLTFDFVSDIGRFLKAGLAMNEAFSAIDATASNRRLRRVVRDVRESVNKGLPLSVAMRRTKVFPELAISVIEVGEKSGNLADVSMYLEKFYKREFEFVSKVKRAAFYPIIVLIFVIAVLLFVSLYALPKFQQAFEAISLIQLPWITRVVLNIGNFIRHGWLSIITVSVICFFAIKNILYKSKDGMFYQWFYRIPLLGEIKKGVDISVIFMNYATLERSGISAGTGLDILSRSIPYPYLARSLSYCRQSVARGDSLSDAFRREKFFPEVVSLLIQKGEVSGQLMHYFDEIAEFYQKTTSERLEKLQVLIEPLLLLLLAIIVLGVYLAFFLAIYPGLNTIAGQAI